MPQSFLITKPILRKWRLSASIVACLNWVIDRIAAFSRVLAAVALLGAALDEVDIFLISVLLLMEPPSADMAEITSFRNACPGFHPQSISTALKQRVLLLPVLVLPLVRLQFGDLGLASALAFSTQVFYCLQFLNSVFVAISIVVIVSTYRSVYPGQPTMSMIGYYQEVLRSALSPGFKTREDSDLLTSAFKTLATNYLQNARVLTTEDEDKHIKLVGDDCGDLVGYFDDHAAGIAFLRQCFAGSLSEQQFAAYMAYYFLKKKNDPEDALFSLLAGKLCTDSTGRAAATTFKHLAHERPELVRKVCNGSGEKIVSIISSLLGNMMSDEVLLETLLATLILLLRSADDVGNLDQSTSEDLQSKLHRLRKSPHPPIKNPAAEASNILEKHHDGRAIVVQQ